MTEPTLESSRTSMGTATGKYTPPDGAGATPAAPPPVRPTPQQAFLRALLGDGLPDGKYAHLFWLHGRETAWVQTVEQAERALLGTSKNDVYMGVGIGPDAGPHHRIQIETAQGVLGLVGDIDIAHTLHKLNTTLPPDQASALKLVDALGADPTLLVHSGHGIQTWHLFEQPWIFKDAEDKQRAIQLEADWQAYINEVAQAQFGWEFDSVGDLARIMRVPGTWNAKDRDAVVPVRLLRWPDARYTPAALEALCAGCAARVLISENAKAMDSTLRFTREHPCPICGGHKDLPQGNHTRCWGYWSRDKLVAFCTREQKRGLLLPLKTRIGEVYVHWLHGACGCGVTHGELSSETYSLNSRGVVEAPVNSQNGHAPATPLRFPLLTDVEAEALPKAQGILGDVLFEDSVAFLYGPPGTWKTSVAQDWGLSVSAGMDWQGRPVKVGAVVYVTGEGARGIGKRIRAWKMARNVTDSLPFYVLPQAVHLLDARHVEALVQTVRAVLGETAPVLIVVDTLARSMAGGDENSAKDTGVLLAAADRLLREFAGCCVLFIHHVGWEPSHMRGSSAMHGGADTVIATLADENALPLRPGAVLKLVSKKAKESEPFQTIALTTEKVEWVEDGDGQVCDGDADDRLRLTVSALVVAQYRPDVTPRRKVGPQMPPTPHYTKLEVAMWQALVKLTADGKGVPNAAWQAASVGKGKLGRASFFRAKAQMVADGWAHESNKLWLATEPGESNALGSSFGGDDDDTP